MFAQHTNRMVCHSKSISSSIIARDDNKHQITCVLHSHFVRLILAWARGASAEEYSFHPQGGLDCARNVTVLVKSIANATQLWPSVLLACSPHG
jgi:hypothetical protein